MGTSLFPMGSRTRYIFGISQHKMEGDAGELDVGLDLGSVDCAMGVAVNIPS